MTGPAANEERLARLRATVTTLGVIAYVLLDLELVASIWGRWALIGWFVLVSALGLLANLGVNRFASRLGSVMAERLRLAGNLLVILLICHLSGWSFQGLVMVVLIGAAQGGSSGHEVVGLTAAVALLGGGFAAVDGAGVLTAITLATAVEGAFWLVYGSARVGSDLLEQLDERHRELAIAHAQLRKVQSVALQQEKLAGLGLMASGIAHEINNPMALITNNVSMLLEDLGAAPELPPEIKEYADEILPETMDGIRRVNAIVADLRRFARREPATGSEGYDLNQQVEHALRIAHSQLKLRCCVMRDLGVLPALVGRPQQMTQVLVNLLVNAAQAIPEAGTITISTRRCGDEATVAVRDTGTGMSSATIAHLFEPFFTTKPSGEGTGLGLAVIHGIVKEHGGRIEVESALGVGSCFTLHLPLSLARSGEASPPALVAEAAVARFREVS